VYPGSISLAFSKGFRAGRFRVVGHRQERAA
jgi:hypothetical protein